jgi:hypothetical protein
MRGALAVAVMLASWWSSMRTRRLPTCSAEVNVACETVDTAPGTTRLRYETLRGRFSRTSSTAWRMSCVFVTFTRST